MPSQRFALTPILAAFGGVVAFLLVLNFAIPEPETTNTSNTTQTANVANTNNASQNTNIANENTNTSNQDVAEPKTYTNSQYKYSLEYPAGWVTQVVDSQSGAERSNGNRTIFWNDFAYQSKIPEGTEWVPTETLYQFVVWSGDPTKDEHLKYPDVIKLLKTQSVTIGGITGVQNTYQGPFSTYTTIYLEKYGRVYGLTIPQLTNEQKHIADEMLASFTFID